MVMKREDIMKAAERRRSLFHRGILEKVDAKVFLKYIRYSGEHGAIILDLEAFSKSTSTVRGNAQIYTRDLISTVGRSDTRDVTPNVGESSSITSDTKKDWGKDLSL